MQPNAVLPYKFADRFKFLAHGGLAMHTSDMQYDIFISHASEDKDLVVRPLVEFLNDLGLRVWFDELSLSVGDSLSRSIDKGLINSKYGAVILSKNFFAKNWPEYELRSLIAKEIESGKVILPIWSGITKDDVLRFSPFLADKYALNAENLTTSQIGMKLLDVIDPDLHSRLVTRHAMHTARVKAPSVTTPVADIKVSRIFRHSKLSADLMSRIRCIRAALLAVYPASMEYWVNGFRMDVNPEVEIKIWENIAAIYMEHDYRFSGKNSQKAFQAILSILAAGRKPSSIYDDVELVDLPDNQKADIVKRSSKSAVPIEGQERNFYGSKKLGVKWRSQSILCPKHRVLIPTLRRKFAQMN